MTSKPQQIQDIIESWFGQEIEHMDNGDSIKKFLLNPIIRIVTSEPSKTCKTCNAILKDGPQPLATYERHDLVQKR